MLVFIPDKIASHCSIWAQENFHDLPTTYLETLIPP